MKDLYVLYIIAGNVLYIDFVFINIISIAKYFLQFFNFYKVSVSELTILFLVPFPGAS